MTKAPNNIINALPPKEVGRRIGEARRSRNVSQDEAAQTIGVSRPTYIAIEKGARPPKPEEIIALAERFGRSVHALLSEAPFFQAFVPQFRVSADTGVNQEKVNKAVADFQRLCEDYLFLENLLNTPLPQLRYPDVYRIERLPVVDAAEEVAQLERSRLNLGQNPITNLPEVLEMEVGIRVFILPLEEFKVAGMFYFTEPLGGCVLVNGSHPATRQFWTMAHEYGHFLMDRYREEVTVLYDYERKPKQERFADAFSAAFLMPAAGVRQRFNHIRQSQEDFKVADLCILADYYGVSFEAMTRRLEGLQCIHKGTWEGLSRHLPPAQVRQHINLPARPGVRQRLPERYQTLAVLAWKESLITESRLADLLRCSRVEAREAVQEMTVSDEIGADGFPYQLDLDFEVVVTPARSGERD